MTAPLEAWMAACHGSNPLALYDRDTSRSLMRSLTQYESLENGFVGYQLSAPLCVAINTIRKRFGTSFIGLKLYAPNHVLAAYTIDVHNAAYLVIHFELVDATLLTDKVVAELGSCISESTLNNRRAAPTIQPGILLGAQPVRYTGHCYASAVLFSDNLLGYTPHAPPPIAVSTAATVPAPRIVTIDLVKHQQQTGY